MRKIFPEKTGDLNLPGDVVNECPVTR